MSFFFNWPTLNSLDLKSTINTFLDSFKVPQFPQIHMTELFLGDDVPQLDLLEIMELNDQKFKGSFRFTYNGALQLTFRSSIEINSINLIEFDTFTKPHFISANKSTVLPVDFTIGSIAIDLQFTVVTKESTVIVVFQKDPQIDLDIKTTIDELMDEDLFEMIKSDTLMMIQEYLKHDLPSMISNLTPRDNIPMALKHSEMDSFDTMSLKPSLNDVVQRVNIPEIQLSTPNKKVKRRIRMKSKEGKTEDVSSSPTLLDSEYGDMEDTLVLHDPYGDLLHPLDIPMDLSSNASRGMYSFDQMGLQTMDGESLKSFELVKTDSFEIREDKQRVRRFSSNYIRC
jgi:hypothetical protein